MHGLQVNKGDGMFSANNIVPWHRIGKVFPVGEEPKTTQEALVAANADFRVTKRQEGWFNPSDAEWVPVDGWWVTVREDTNAALGRVGADYTVLQNEDGFASFDPLIEHGATLETGGTLWGGRKVFLTAALDKFAVAGERDEIETYALFTNSHDGYSNLQMAVTDVRVVCQNTLNIALKSAKRVWKVRHTQSVGERFKEALDYLGLVKIYNAEFTVTANNLHAVTMSASGFRKLLEDIDFPKRSIDQVIFLGDNAANLEDVRGTGWAWVNAVVEHWDHGRNPRQMDSFVDGILYPLGGNWKDKVVAKVLATAGKN